jgi:hypothetical protein
MWTFNHIMQTSLRVTVDTSKLVTALLKTGSSSLSTLRKEMGAQMERVQLSAKREHRFVTRGGMLANSILPFVSSSGLLGRVYLDQGLAPYGAFVHNGTGIYGKRRKPIVPRVAPLLRWRGLDGRYHSAKSVRGIKPDRFLYEAFKRASKEIVAGLQKAYVTILKNGGLA